MLSFHCFSNVLVVLKQKKDIQRIDTFLLPLPHVKHIFIDMVLQPELKTDLLWKICHLELAGRFVFY